MNKIILKSVSTFLLLWICLCAYPQSYAFRGLSNTDGLSDLVVSALYKDSTGFVWIGTASSLERFDGVRLKRYAIPGTNEKLKWVNTILEVPGNEIWVGNDMGLWRLNEEEERLEQISPEVISSGVRSLLLDSKGTLYIGSTVGLFVYRKGEISRTMIDSNVSSSANSIMGLDLTADGILWMLTENGLYSLHPADGKITRYDSGIEKNSICTYRKMARVGSVLYLGTMEQGILSFDIRSRKFSRFVDVGCNVISSLSGDGKDLLYVGTDGNGVHFVSTSRKKIVHSFRHESGQEESIRSNSVYSLLVDREGLIWIGFYQLGLDYTLYQSGLFSVYNFPPFFNSRNMPIRTLSIGDHEKIVGSRDGLFYIDEKNRRFKSFKTPELRSQMILCSYAFRGNYYIGTYGGGMYVFDPSSMTVRDFEPDLPIPFTKGHVFCIKSDPEGQLWVGTSAGIYCYKEGKPVRHYTSNNSKLPGGNVYDIFFDSTRKGWICTENGLCIWDPSSGSLKADIFPEGFVNRAKIRTVYEDSEHRLYFLPNKGPVFTSDLSMTRFGPFPPGTPLDGKDAMFMIEDKEGWLWIGTNNGMYRYDRKKTFIPYDFADGVPSPIFISCLPVSDPQGKIWFGNSKGLICTDTRQENKKEKSSYPIAITDIYVNGEQAIRPSPGKNKSEYLMTLDASQKNVTICFTGFTYTDPVYMSYEYRLEGRDENWKVLSGKSELTYYDLPSGAYRFKIRQVGDPGSEVSLSIKKSSSFGVGMRVFTLFVLVMLAAGYIYLRRKNIRLWDRILFLFTPGELKVIRKTDEKYKTHTISAEECKRLAEKLEQVMRDGKPYTNPELKITDLAAAAGTSSYVLSYLFNQYLNRNYSDYINDYRIAEFKRLVKEGEHNKYSLNALVERCGFGSRASFFRNFKKAAGITPNEYIQNQEKSGK